MKIGQQPDISPAAGQTAQSATSKAGQAAAPAARNDRKAPGVGVTVSSQARALEQSSGAADVDMEKVNAVKQAIEKKSYAVNAETIADKLLANAREMLDRSRG
jgi:negative regulator of flagellin synthesis FlgM